jgi:hypothetical protein
MSSDKDDLAPDPDTSEVPEKTSSLMRFWQRSRWLMGLGPNPEPAEADVARLESQPTGSESLEAYSLAIRPLARPENEVQEDTVLAVKLAIDLGTSASAVVYALEPDPDNKDIPVLVDFGPLGQRSAMVGNQAPLIGSQILFSTVPLEGPSHLGGDELHCFIGAQADLVRKAFPEHSVAYYTSVKRLLDLPGGSGGENAADVNLPKVVEGVFRELLFLALLPEESETVRVGRLLKSGSGTSGDEVESAKIGLPRRAREYLRERIAQDGLELFITMPNSFSFREVESLKNASTLAGQKVMERLAAQSGGLGGRAHTTPVVQLLRESEAIAWWEYALDRDQGLSTNSEDDPERWLVFDMGAGTTDLALLEVGGQDIRLIRRSGIPVGGDDFDHAFLQHLEPGMRMEAALAAHTEQADGVDRMLAAVRDLKRTGGAAAARKHVIWHPDLLEQLAYDERVMVKEAAEHCKRSWSTAQSWKKYIGDQVDEEKKVYAAWDDWLVATLQRRTDHLLDAQALEGDELLLVPLWQKAYRQLVMLITRGCCLGLVGEVGAKKTAVNRVILSGRSALLPGIQRALERALRDAGLMNAETKVTWVRGQQAGGAHKSQDAKLAVVRGAATFAWNLDVVDTPARMSDQITARARGLWDKVVIDLNTQLDPMGRCRALYRMSRPTQRAALLLVHRHRIPKDVVEDFCGGDSNQEQLDIRKSNLCRKRLFRSTIPKGTGDWWLGFQLDEREGRIALFQGDGSEDLKSVSEDPGMQVSLPRHPVTGLLEDWQWSGDGSPSRGGGAR